MVRKDESWASVASLIEAGLPEGLARHIHQAKSEALKMKAQRYVDYWRSHPGEAPRLTSAWAKIAAAVCDYRPRGPGRGDLINLVFSQFPATDDRQPLAALNGGRRALDPRAERERYDRWTEHLREVLKLVSDEILFTQLFSDSFDGNAREALEARAQLEGESPRVVAAPPGVTTRVGHSGAPHRLAKQLEALDRLLSIADPAKKYFTAHPGAADAGRKTYVARVAALNEFLSEPQHSALARLSPAMSGIQVTRKELEAAWRRRG